MPEKITIYIPVYNGANYIDRAIDSVLKQTYKNISLIISDNCSTDETVSIVNSYLDDKRITLFRQPFNLGMVKQGNFLLGKISTKYCMGLCHDDFIYDDKALEMAVEILDNNDRISVVYSDMMFVDKSGMPIVKNKYNFQGLTPGDIVAKKSIINCRNLYSIPLLLRTKSFDGFKFTEGFYHTLDLDFSISISKGNQIYYIPKTLVALRFHKNNNTAKDYSGFIEEFKQLASKHNIELSKAERFQMEFNHRITVFKKNLFYFYLDKIRR